MDQFIEMETRLYISPMQSRYFDIYEETPIPYEHKPTFGRIELCEVIDLGYNDYVMIPLQVYRTGDAMLNKLVVLIDMVKCDLPYVPLVEINEQNIRTFQMTKDGKVFMPRFERVDPTNIELECNKKIEYQLIDITPKANYERTCALGINYYTSERKLLKEQERIKLFHDEGKITYIVQAFGFREHDIILLPNQEDDVENTLRFQVLNNVYYEIDGKLHIEQ